MSSLKQENNKQDPINLNDTRKLIQVRLRKDPREGFGFNLVGGTDMQYLAGHSDIFVTRIRPKTPAARDSRLEPGDIIVSINGINLSEVSHESALRLLRTAKEVSEIVVEKGGEKRILSSDLDFPEGTIAATKVDEVALKFFQDQRENSGMDKPNISTSRDTIRVLSDDEKFYTPLNSPGSNKFSTRHQLLRSNHRLGNSESLSTPYVKSDKNIRNLSFSLDDEEETASAFKESDEESSATSSAASSISANPSCFLPAVKKQSPLDYIKGRVSLTHEVFVMSLGVVALSATVFFAYRWYKKH